MPRVFSLLAISLFLGYSAAGQTSLSSPTELASTLGLAKKHESLLAAASVQCQYVTVNYPGAYTTQLEGINNKGKVIGIWSSQTDLMYGFTWSSGSFASVTVPNSRWTYAKGVNDVGDVVGSFSPKSFAVSHASNSQLAFVLADGKYTVIDPPDSGGYSYAVAINNHRDILGYAGASPFLLRNGKFSYFSIPNGVTFPDGMNNQDEIIGTFEDSEERMHGFVFQNGKYVIVDFPGATATSLNAVSDAGVLLGTWSNGQSSGNFRLQNGKFERLPNSVYPTGTMMRMFLSAGPIPGLPSTA